ncbi:TPA: helix-turn-helix domain-containing protein [Pseudomonas aeruginosa]|nr:helix-turn-helix domain-containing protein [Pseudomonas aeruginosa]AYN85726.1 DNA-binding protein [Pseudomonas aeruginosa]MCO3029476.1 helix-turn-helix domain-containing protein [Pseudomonas aeruginosa]MCO3851202.1 helix-turn-helix domain-containing protein [Pseudomonas aeruginosa]MDV6851958.1 helix-turn-helix domain-containing protein [Pseudomonas aeruginosa]MDV6911081.1 helix-turn-helix domain-containing protein [Pseudomonas aeruginosa]
MQALLTVEQLSEYLQKSVASIRSYATRNPQSLPPICRLPGTKRLLWRVADVEQWLAEHVTSAPRIPLVAASEPPKRGRPTKAEQVTRSRRSAS